MIPPATVHSVPMTVMVLGWTPRRTSQFATGSMTFKYPFLSQSGRSFMRLRVSARGSMQRRGAGAAGRTEQKRQKAGALLRSEKYPVHEVVATGELANALLRQGEDVRSAERHVVARIRFRTVDRHGLQ